MAKVEEEEIVLTDEFGNEETVPYITLMSGHKLTQREIDEWVEEIDREREKEEEENLVWLTMYIYGDVFDAAEARAKNEGRKPEDLIREAVERYLES